MRKLCSDGFGRTESRVAKGFSVTRDKTPMIRVMRDWA